MRRHIDLRPLRRQPLAALEHGRRTSTEGGRRREVSFYVWFSSICSHSVAPSNALVLVRLPRRTNTHTHTHILASIFSLTSRPRSKQEALLSASDSASPRNSKTPQEFDQMLVSSLCVASVRQPASAFKKRKPSEACTTMTDDENILERRGVFFVFLCPDLTDPKRLIPNLD